MSTDPHDLHDSDRRTALILRTRATVARSQALRAESTEQLLLARAALAQAQDQMRHIDPSRAGFDTRGNVSMVSNDELWRSLGEQRTG